MVFALIGSLTVALISSAVAWRLYRLEQLRSDARVAALSTAIGDGTTTSADEFAWETPPPARPDAPSLFTHAQHSTRINGPLLTATATLAAGVLVVVLMAMLADGERPSPIVDAPTAEALELLSMSHARDGAALVVTGLVRNASQTLTAPLTTVVTALDAEGHVVGTGSVTLTGVAPGDTRPFSVRLDGVNAVGRYRISFRTNDGVMPHVDRRGTRGSARAAAE
jgi:hypothetical protein